MCLVGWPENRKLMFLHCGVAWKIWDELLIWLQGAFIMPPNLFIHWACWDGLATNKKVKRRVETCVARGFVGYLESKK